MKEPGGAGRVFKRKENGFLATRFAKQTLMIAEVTEVTSRLTSCWLSHQHFGSGQWGRKSRKEPELKLGWPYHLLSDGQV